MKNDFRDYICHSKDHKYVSKHKNRFGRWIYIYKNMKNQLKDYRQVEKEAKKYKKQLKDLLNNQMIVDKGSQKVADDIARKKGHKVDDRRRVNSLKNYLEEYYDRYGNWLDKKFKPVAKKYGDNVKTGERHMNKFADNSEINFQQFATNNNFLIDKKTRKKIKKFILKEKQHQRNLYGGDK